MEWKCVTDAPPLEPYLVISQEWKHADVCISDEDGWWYNPVDGSDVFPQPTHWMPLPPAPEAVK